MTAADGKIIVEDNAPEIRFSSVYGELLDWFYDSAPIDVIVEDSKGGKDIGKGIKGAFSRFIEVDYNKQGYKDYSGEARKQLKKSSVYKLKEILESITKAKA